MSPAAEHAAAPTAIFDCQRLVAGSAWSSDGQYFLHAAADRDFEHIVPCGIEADDASDAVRLRDDGQAGEQQQHADRGDEVAAVEAGDEEDYASR